MDKIKYKIMRECNKIQCLECGKFIKGINVYNIKRHFKLVHKDFLNNDIKKESSDDDTAPPTCRKKAKSSEVLMDRNGFLRCCVGLVTVKNLPLELFDDEEFFKLLIMPYQQKFKTNLNSQNIVPAIRATSDKIESIIREKVNSKMVCLKLDIATKAGKSLLGINIQYIKDFKICMNTLGIVQLHNRCSATYIEEEIMKCLRNYDIDSKQIYSTTTDNGAYVVKVGKMLEEDQEEMIPYESYYSAMATHDDEHTHSAIESIFPVERCAAQSIQLAAYDVIKSLKKEVNDCRQAVKNLRTTFGEDSSNLKMPVLDNATCWNSTQSSPYFCMDWNSTFDMIKSLLEVKEELKKTESEDDGTFEAIKWDFISEFVTTFNPLVNLAKELRNDQYILGDFYRDWLTCELELQQLIWISPLAQKLHDAMEKRKELLLKNDTFIAALYVDPRFNFHNSPFLTDDQKNKAVTHLCQTFDVIKMVENLPTSQENPLSTTVPEVLKCEDSLIKSPSAYSLLECHSAQLMAIAPATAATKTAIKQNLIFLSSCTKMPFDTDVLKYWKHAQDCDLMKIAEAALAVPPTQLSVEKAFSALSLIITNSRSKLENDTLNSLLVTKLNFSEISCKAVEKTVSESE